MRYPSGTNGKEHGNYYNGLYNRGYMGLYRGYIGSNGKDNGKYDSILGW